MKILPWVQNLDRTYSKHSMNFLADEDLVRAMCDGDDMAFEIFYRRHKEGLYFFLMRFLNRRDLCEEVMQETFLKFYQTTERFNPLLSKPRTWLYNIARNSAIDSLRKKSEYPWDESEEVAAPSMDFVLNKSLEEALIESAQKDELHLAIARLVPSQREAILLWMQELSYEEMAQVSEKSVQAMKNLVNRARGSLMTMLEGQRDAQQRSEK